MKEDLKQFFNALDRSYFMEINKEYAHLDSAIAIGYEQTISQPSLVLMMTEYLELDKSHRVLEIGTGTGYQTAFLAEFSAMVYTIERIEPLYVKAKERLLALGYHNITYILGDGSIGYEAKAPYDRIIVTAAANKVPHELIDQLGPNGKLIIPVGDQWLQDLLLVSKDSQQHIKMQTITQVRFVPLVGKYEIYKVM
jgi:protein-L-isoaspartate(D-aspartate) O-methyltransferase